MKKDKLIQTDKVLVTCALTITGLSCHAGSGEDWADEPNAMTAAESQAMGALVVRCCLRRICGTTPVEAPCRSRWIGYSVSFVAGSEFLPVSNPARVTIESMRHRISRIPEKQLCWLLGRTISRERRSPLTSRLTFFYSLYDGWILLPGASD